MVSIFNGSDNFDTAVGGADKTVSFHSVYGVSEQTITSTSLVNISDLSITMTPTNANNIIILEASISNTRGYVMSFTFLKGGSKTLSSVTTNNSNETDCHVTSYWGYHNDYSWNTMLMHKETAGSTSSRTYTVAATSGWAGTNYTIWLNQRSAYGFGASSWFNLWEIAP